MGCVGGCAWVGGCEWVGRMWACGLGVSVGASGWVCVCYRPSLPLVLQDFMEEPTEKFLHLAPGREVRLKYAGCITCDEVKPPGPSLVLVRV